MGPTRLSILYIRADHYLLQPPPISGADRRITSSDRIETLRPMSNSKFSDAKGNCSNEIGDHVDVQNHGLVNNQTLDLHQSNQSVDGANTLKLGTPTNGGPFPSMNNQLPKSAEPESAVINGENPSSLPRSRQPSNKKLRKRKADMKDFAKYRKKIDKKCKRLKNANTSLENENVFLKNRLASMKRYLKRQKKISDYWKEKYNELTDKAMDLSMHLLTQSNSQ